MPHLTLSFKRILFISITSLGIGSVITQILFIRESLHIFHGNEAVFGIVLGSWFLLTGIGSFSGKFSEKLSHRAKLTLLTCCQLLIAFLPFILVVLLRTLKNNVFMTGRFLSLNETLLTSLILLSPYCIISGMMLTLATAIYTSDKRGKSIGAVYFIDNIGDIIGGALFSFLLIYVLGTLENLSFIAWLNLFSAFLLSMVILKDRILLSLTLVTAIVFFAINMSFDIDRLTMERLFPKQELITRTTSPYGDIVITKQENQYNFYENSVPLFSTDNIINIEEKVHYPMSQSKNPGKTLLISGGISGTVKELLKYKTRIDYIEADYRIIAIWKEINKQRSLDTTYIDSNRVRVVHGDGRKFLKTSDTFYDVIIVDMPDPVSARINRFYTDEFFKEAKIRLHNNGVLGISLSSDENYMSKEAAGLNAVIYNTLINNFKNVIIIPGGMNFYIASDSDMDYKIAERLKKSGIDTVYVKEEYLNALLSEERIRYIADIVNEESDLNRDLKPLAYFHYLLYEAAFYNTNSFLLLATVAVVVVFIISRLNYIGATIFTTGIAGSAFEVVILLSFQVIHGYVYHKVGVLITFFMAGVALGAFIANRLSRSLVAKALFLTECLFVALSLLIPFVILFINNRGEENVIYLSDILIFPGIALITGILTGAEFPLASRLMPDKGAAAASELYLADFAGAFTGAVLVSALLIPLIGTINVCLLTGVVKIVSAMFFLKGGDISKIHKSTLQGV